MRLLQSQYKEAEKYLTAFFGSNDIDSIIKETLGTVMDRIFNESDLRSTTGGVGLLTHDIITRIDLNEQAFVMALTQFVNDDIWKD